MKKLSETTIGRARTQDLRDFLRVYAAKKDSLREVTCVECGTVFGTNVETTSCFNCNAKIRETQQG